MDKINVNVRVVEDNRVSIATFGTLYGHRIYKATKEACCLDFNSQLRDAQENNGLTTNRTPYRYKIVPIDITGLNLEKDIDGTNVIVINKGQVDESGESIEVRCPIDNNKFTKEVTTDNIADAINKKDCTATYFANARKLVEALNPSNKNEIARIEKLIGDLQKMRDMISQTADYNVTSVNDYYKQLDKENEQVKLNIRVSE